MNKYKFYFLIIILIIYGTSAKSIELTNDSIIYAVIYAPKSSIILDTNSQLFGALIGDQVLMKNNSRIHFDECLKSTSRFDLCVPPHVEPIIQY